MYVDRSIGISCQGGYRFCAGHSGGNRCLCPQKLKRRRKNENLRIT